MDYLEEHIPPRVRMQRSRPLTRSLEPRATIEDMMPRWILAGLLMLLCVQLAIAL